MSVIVSFFPTFNILMLILSKTLWAFPFSIVYLPNLNLEILIIGKQIV